MIKKYFLIDENFEEIIKNSLKNVKIVSINKISTGWTNIVFEVCTIYGDYFFRFPRDEFWARTIVKDYQFSKFIYGKTDFNTVQLEIMYDKERPYSMHKKIEGTVFADKMTNMTEDEVKIVSNDIAKFMFQVHSLKFDYNEVFTIDNIGLNLIDFLDELLNIHVAKEDMKFWDYSKFIKKDNTCLVHGDLNSSNIILDENNHISAIIDFGFGGFGNKYFDIARIIGRCPNKFKQEIIQRYEESSNDKINYKILDNEISIWKNIDNAYINYMKKIGIYK